jgi:hypothetical protein
MTRHTWSTLATIPPAPWAALAADMRRLLAVAAATGSTVTNPAADGPPVLDAEHIGFTVVAAAAGSPPMTVEFTRAPGQAGVDTSSMLTGGLVLAALARGTRHWGGLLTWTSEADASTRGVADSLVTRLFAAEDAAVGVRVATVSEQIDAIVARARGQVTAGAGETFVLDVLGYLTVLIDELGAIRAGWHAAEAIAGVGGPPPDGSDPGEQTPPEEPGDPAP